MAASASDKARKSYSYLQKTLSGGISDSDTSLTLNNNTNVPTDTGVTMVIDRVDSSGTRTPTKREIVTGALSGGNITGLTRGQDSTTAQAHTNGAVVEFVLAGDLWNDLIDFLLVDHSNPAGHHKSLTDDNNNEWLERGSVASAVNQVKITNAITATKPIIEAAGDDTNIGLTIKSKGTGDVDILPASTGLVKTDGAVPRSFFALYNFIESGCVWSGDSYGSTRAASMTAGFVWIAGKRLTVAAVTARSFTASKDTYVDFQDNGDGTALIVYTEATNNAASPAIPNSKTDATNVRGAIIVTGAGSIANVGSVNMGENDKVLPIASSVPYQVTDSLGYLISPRDPNRKVLGKREITTAFSTASATWVQVTGLSCPVQVPVGRKVKVTAFVAAMSNSAVGYSFVGIFEGTVTDTNRITSSSERMDVAGTSQHVQNISDTFTPASSGLVTFNIATKTGAGTVSLSAQARKTAAESGPMYVLVELE